ncbi:MAG: rhodanese-like domain-containing protein [Saprospiraceae bacterium]|nr:rhodanese-like domain-containing protein [Saprospiraceae bacterium]
MDITVQELKQKLDNQESFIFIDVREPHEYVDFNIGAKLIPLGTLSDQIIDFEANKNDEIVVHCRSGARSGVAKELFERAGFTNVRNLIGGVLAWAEAFPVK